MIGQKKLGFAQNFLQKLGAGYSQALALLFAEDARWEIAGDEGALLPWFGKKKRADRLLLAS